MSVKMIDKPCKVLFVFSWLVVGGEETEVRLLARHLNPLKYKLDVVACFQKPGMPQQTHEQLKELGVKVDTAPYKLSFKDTVSYLAKKMQAYDVVVACQAVPDVYPALEQLVVRPILIEHGGLVSEALKGPKNLTARYIGVCDSIRAAAASVMPDKPQDAVMIPSMVDLSEFNTLDRDEVRAELGVVKHSKLIGWVGRLDRKKRVEDFIKAAALVKDKEPLARFVIIGGPDAFMPEYERELKAMSDDLALKNELLWLGDRKDVPRLLSALDIFVWLSKDEGMPHVINEAGAAGLPVIATKDNGTAEQIVEGYSGLFVPHQSRGVVADYIINLLNNPALATELGRNLKKKVEDCYSATAVARQWEALFDEVLEER